jgi:anthraniloyl-CoA monooxygenase
MKRIVCMGGGPAGLYSAILLRKAFPGARVEVFERNRPDDTFGWGVVFSDATMAGFREADAETHAGIVSRFHHWDDIDVHWKGQVVRTGGHGFCGIKRTALLGVLQERAARLGVGLSFEQELDDDARFADADLVVVAEGVNSKTRQRHQAVFRPDVDVRRCRFIWLGTEQKFPAFTFAFEKTEHGWFQIHAYQFSGELSTVIVETREETWRAHGLDRVDAARSIDFCERLFAKPLGGARLLSNAGHQRGSAWLNFHRVVCRSWRHGNRVLVGDAAHTAHFSIGSGTKLAMEDAISLTRHVAGGGDVPGAMAAYQAERGLEALSSRARRATTRSGSRTWRTTKTSSRCSSPTAYSPAASASGMRISSCGTRPSSSASSRTWPSERASPRARRRRRCSCRSTCAECASRTAWWSRPWRSTARSTGCPATGTWCTTARAPPAEPAWCSPR